MHRAQAFHILVPSLKFIAFFVEKLLFFDRSICILVFLQSFIRISLLILEINCKDVQSPEIFRFKT